MIAIFIDTLNFSLLNIIFWSDKKQTPLPLLPPLKKKIKFPLWAAYADQAALISCLPIEACIEAKDKKCNNNSFVCQKIQYLFGELSARKLSCVTRGWPTNNNTHASSKQLCLLLSHE